MRDRRGLARALVCLVFMAAGCGHSSGGERWIQSNHQAIRTVNPADTDFSDLQFLKQAIGEKRVVQLGESAHGTAEFSSMKVRLIKFLHQEMGFDVVAFESRLFDCYRANERIDSRSAYQTMRDCVFGVWHTAEANALFEYLQSTRATARPLILAGFDIQLPGRLPDLDRPAQIRQAAAPFDAVLAEQVAAVDQEFIGGRDPTGYATANVDRVGPLYTRLAALIAAHAAEIDAAFPNRPGFAAALESSVRWTPTFMDVLRRGSTDPDGMTLRDFGMAEQVEVLLERIHRGKKVVIWAHNAHIARDGGLMTYGHNPGWAHVRTMGKTLHERRAADLHTIGLFMVRGQAAHNTRSVYDIEPPQEHSLEELFDGLRSPVAFVNMLNVPSGEGTGWMYEHLAAWDWGYKHISLIPRDQFDALLVVAEVHPPRYI